MICGPTIDGQLKLLPPPDFIKTADQPHSPLNITINERYDNGGNFDPVNYMVRNDSQKSIRTIVITGFPKDANHVVGFGTLRPGATRKLSYGDLNARKSNEIFTLTVDYVLFTDGTHWGADKAKESEFVLGLFDGQKRIYQEIKKLVELNDDEAFIEFLTKPSNSNLPAELSPPGGRTRKDEGFARGYTAWRHAFAFDFQNRGDLKGVSSKLSDLEGELGIAPSQGFGFRRIERNAARNEPVKFVGLSLGSRKIDFDENYEAAMDWLKDLSIKIRNDSGKTVAFISLSLDFPETLETGNMMAFPLSYGQHQISSEKIVGRKEDKPVPPGQSFDIGLDEKRYADLKRFLDSRQGANSLTRAKLGIASIYYNDGTGWSGGQNIKQDPNDPKRWIPVD